jgi:hypothetical protein
MHIIDTERLVWHKPRLQRLLVSVQTADFLKDSSTEDLEIKGAPGLALR